MTINKTDIGKTGRYFIIDKASGRKFCVEPVHGRDQKETDRVFTNGGYDGESVKNKSQVTGGSVSEEDSIITPENGYKNITTLERGHSPMDYIEKLLQQ